MCFLLSSKELKNKVKNDPDIDIALKIRYLVVLSFQKPTGIEPDIN